MKESFDLFVWLLVLKKIVEILRLSAAPPHDISVILVQIKLALVPRTVPPSFCEDHPYPHPPAHFPTK
jgi:hypothetical protein